ncbi:hypothetical protein PILCRDRAFT_822100 [Piloderma croceum F 1598]|uniref:Chromatin assembly factor 1 subunit A dimerization domain-containing protein n=1 Tax=Piloderma croceum (strain F 1598) TaxID=765440 RepID=A0A0C3FNN5_PILCF|nr:hypothetical protein PILCRDRAFT_822100 [Piloderma croceum F 1598]
MTDADADKETTAEVIDEKPEKRSIVELKNGKVVFKQKPISFDKHSETMQEIVKFREMLEQRIERGNLPLTAYPDEHKPLVAKLANESDKTAAVLAKHIRNELLPSQDEDDEDINSESANVSASLPLSVVEAAVKSILIRKNYGLDAPLGGGKLPTALCVWRWEVKEEHRDWLPKAAREKADGRLAERIHAKKDLAAIFESLSQDERDAIIDPKGTARRPTKDTNKASVSPAKSTGTEAKNPPHQPTRQQKKLDDENEAQSDASLSKAGASRPKKEADPEKVAKEKEKLEKKTAKAEKEKKEKEAQNKSRSIMANFFGKPKTNSARASPAQESEAAVAPGSSSSQSAFEKTFKPFVVKKDAEVARPNWFLNPKTNKLHRKRGVRDVIVIDDDDASVKKETVDVKMEDIHEVASRISQMSTKECLASILSTLPPSADPSFSVAPRRRLSVPCHTTRTILSQLSEAEIADNPSLVRSLLSVLRNRDVLPAKILIFTEDARPGYFGTWTRHSRIIGPRTPFARDLVALDYAYDSGEEWEEEGTGDADDVVEGADDDDGVTEADSDLDSWLVDDDDIGEIGTPLEEREVDPLPAVLNFPAKRKAEDGERKIGKKRKVVVPLVPFAKGPYWESDVGYCTYEPFQPYRIQLFNDTPYPINPFTFVSAPQEKQTKSSKEITSALSNDATFAVPSLPDRLLSAPSTITAPILPSSSTNGPASNANMKRTNSAPAPKTTFPDAHLPALVSKIAALETSNITFLVESIYQELRPHKVKKNAIEAKIKEVGEKCKEKKVWIIKPSVTVPQAVPPI